MKPNRAENTGKQSLSGRVLLRSGGVLLGVALLAALAPSISAPAGAQNPPPVTYTRDVAPILQAKCQECHRPGSIGPFSLLTYADAKARAKGIQEYTQRRIMPPWKAADGFGEFQDVRRLTDAQIQTIAHWVDVGAPEGDPKDLPPPRQFAEGWTLGTPDLVLDAGEPFEVPAREGDLYRNFVLPFYSQDDQWLSAVEFSPGSAEVVHHVVLLLDPQGKSPALDKAEPEPGFTVIGFTAGFSPALWLEGWAPGATPHFHPEGTAWKLPARSHLVMQVHYHSHGQAVKDRTRIGLHFARGPIDKRVRASGALGNLSFQIPPGDARHEVRASVPLPRDITMLGLWPHMHLLGREMKAGATLPDGSEKPLVWIPEWDFYWQLGYAFKQPLKLPRGTRLDLVATYDNSADNPNNPTRPPKTVGFGPETTDEMCFCFFLYTVDAEHLTQGQPVESDELELRL